MPAAPYEAQQAFQRQAGAVGAATAAIARRLATEGRSAIIEGVHLLPGQLSEVAHSDSKPVVVEMLLTLADESLHRAHLTCRLDGEPTRGGQRHLKHFDSIRAVQGTLRDLARQAGIVEYDIADPEDLTQRLVDQVVASVRAADHRKAGVA